VYNTRPEWEGFAENPDMVYLGSGMFMNRETFSMLEVSGYDETVESLIQQRLKDLGRGTGDESGDANTQEAAAPAEVKPPEPQVANPPEEAEEIRRALFNRPGG
jgi:hypothetical protein